MVIASRYGCKFYQDPTSRLDFFATNDRICPWLLQHLAEVIDESAVAVDVGANAGYVGLEIARYATKGHVHFFEPIQTHFWRLCDNVDLNGLRNVTLYSQALQGNPKQTSCDMQVRGYRDGDGFMNLGLSTLETAKTCLMGIERVACSTLDLIAQHLDRLDLIKIDTEGSEFRVLLGGLQTIHRFRPVIVYEFLPELDKEFGTNNTVCCFEMLRLLGYKQNLMSPEGLRLISQYEFLQGDVLATPEEQK